MIKKILVSFFLASLFLPVVNGYAQETTTITPTPSEEYDFASMTTYELFWPITAGKVPGDKFYSLKTFRDNFMASLIFGNLKKAEFWKGQANKRLVEAERLLELQRDQFFVDTLEKSKQSLQKGLEFLSSAEDSSSTVWLRSEYAKDLQKYLVVLERMNGKTSGDQKTAVENFRKSVEEFIDKYNLKI